jgi:hypothetical protein
MPQCKLLTVMYMSTDSIKLELQEVELEGVDWSFVALDRDQLLACRNMKV